MTKAKRALVALLGVMVGWGNSIPVSAAPAESFDKPVRKALVSLGRSPTLMPNDPTQIQLSCFYYPAFLVKQLDDPGQKGTQWVTIDPVPDGRFPACRESHSPTERFLAKDGWWFIGVKGSLLFFEAPDGTSGGMPVRVLDLKTGTKIFEDSVWWKSHLEFVPTPDGKIALKYLRLVEGDCSIPKDAMSCWSKFRDHYGLALAAVPNCTGYRRKGDKEWVVGDAGVPPEEISVPSAIAYPVVVVLFPRPLIRAVSGQVTCNPVE
jgi:hypothetical protein